MQGFDDASRRVADDARLNLELSLESEGIEHEVVLLDAPSEEALPKEAGSVRAGSLEARILRVVASFLAALAGKASLVICHVSLCAARVAQTRSHSYCVTGAARRAATGGQ